MDRFIAPHPPPAAAKFKQAQNLDVEPAVLDPARAKHPEAHTHWAWWLATQGAHFHNPQQFKESINKGMVASQAGIELLDDAMAPKRAALRTVAAAPAPAPAASK